MLMIKKQLCVLLCIAVLLSALHFTAAALAPVTAQTLCSTALSGGQDNASLLRLQRAAVNDYSALGDEKHTALLDEYAAALERAYLGEGEGLLQERAVRIADYTAAIGISFTDAYPVIQVKSVTNITDITLLIELYEWTLVQYTERGADDLCGYGFEHTLTVQDGKIAAVQIENDEFGERRELVQQYGATDESAAAASSSSYSYNPAAAVEYADRYALEYNTAYANYNNSGGDCANFVSQCLYAGGLPSTDGWYWRSRSDCARSWIYVPSMIAYLKGYGSYVRSATAADIITGSPVFYFASAASEGTHTAICVGTNAAGTPVVNAHNNDRYRVNWQLGGSAYWAGGVGTIKLQSTAAATTAATTTPIENAPSERVSGDVNEDGELNAKDILALRRHLADHPDDINRQNADCNADGKISAADLLQLRRYLAGHPVQLL